VTDFASENLTGSRFEDVYLTDARFHDVDLTNARFHLVDLTGVMIRGAALVNVDISGEIKNLRVNGVDVVPLVEAELNRRPCPVTAHCDRGLNPGSEQPPVASSSRLTAPVRPELALSRRPEADRRGLTPISIRRERSLRGRGSRVRGRRS
jgi:hypothetical protein